MTVFPGAKARYTESLSFLTPSSKTEGIPVYRVMDKKGDIILPEGDPNLPDEQLLKMYKVKWVLLTNRGPWLFYDVPTILCILVIIILV